MHVHWDFTEVTSDRFKSFTRGFKSCNRVQDGYSVLKGVSTCNRVE